MRNLLRGALLGLVATFVAVAGIGLIAPDWGLQLLDHFARSPGDGLLLLLAPAPAVMTRDLKTILAEMKALQDKYKGKPMPTEEATKFEELAAEAQPMQDEIDRNRKTRSVEESEREGKRLQTTTLPDDTQPEAKRPTIISPVGYMKMGAFILAHGQVEAFRKAGRPQAPWLLAKVKDLTQPVVGITAEQLAEFQKAVPTIAADVIEPQRLSEVVRVTEHDTLTLRDLLDVQRTGSDAVKFTRITAYTRAAAAVARSALKPQAGLTIDAVTESVRTIAVWIPVENQQLDDLPQLRGIIDTELLYDLDKHVEELVIWGDGLGENFEGIAVNPLVLPMRTEVGDTLIDVARRGITDVRRAGYSPNGIAIDPLDWEDVVLEKGSDNRYVWVVVTEGDTMRLWGVRVVETVAMEDFSGNATEARVMVVGDFARGATLWDREDSSVQVGWQNDQFVRNQRTLLAERRAAFGVKRPGAFRKHETQAAVAS